MSESRPSLAVIDYGMGNLRSVCRAWERAGARPRLVSRVADVRTDDAVVFPGQGAIVDAMKLLRQTGFDGFLRDWIAADHPYFGICLGLQALFEFSEEGQTPCLGIFPGTVRRFRFAPASPLKVPHMGWNDVRFSEPDGEGLGRDGAYYFVHSYYAAPEQPELVWGTTTYGDLTFCSALARGNCVATQFHPEKSQQMGLDLYHRYVERLQQRPIAIGA